MAYVRFHGTNGRYAGNYPDHMLHDWANWLKAQSPNVRAIYAYFNNDISGHALNNAQTLKQIMGVAYASMLISDRHGWGTARLEFRVYAGQNSPGGL